MNRMTYVGHATVEIELDGIRLITDPVLRQRVVHLRRQVAPPGNRAAPDAVLLSHRHFDHLDLPTLRRIGRSVRIISGKGTRKLLERRGFTRIEELAIGESSEIGGVTVTAVPAVHDGRRRPGSGPGEAVGFLIAGSRQIYFAGDTDLYPEMDRISTKVDLALIPVWGWGHTLGTGHLDPAGAARAVELIRPEVVVPIHWGTFFPVLVGHWGRHHLTEPPKRFAAQVAESSPGVEVRLIAPGDSTGLG